MFTFLHEMTTSWSGSTATRLVDACRAHLTQKRQQLEIASAFEENALRASAEAQTKVEVQERELEKARAQLASHIDTHTQRLKTLAQAVMAISSTASAENIETVEQVLEMASACSPESFVAGVKDANVTIAGAELSLTSAQKDQMSAKVELVHAKERRTSLQRQIQEIESIRSQLQPEMV